MSDAVIPAATLHRVAKTANTFSAPIPAQFDGDAYAWAGAWVAENGMTLPPDTNEYRSLRNRFCWWLQCWKKGTLKEKHLSQFALHGIDFSHYRATNTGTTTRDDDAAQLAYLRKRHQECGTYDLDHSAPSHVLKWQENVLNSFYASGRTTGCERVEKALPGLNLGRWRKPVSSWVDAPAWWEEAAAFRRQNAWTPAFRGTLHPNTPPQLADWARRQQHLALDGRRGDLSPGQRGELIDLGILDNASQRSVNKAREQARSVLGVPARLTAVDRHLDAFLGAACFVLMVARERPLLAMCREFATAPHSIEELLAAAAPELAQLCAFGDSGLQALLPTVRQLEQLEPGLFQPDRLAQVASRRLDMPVQLTDAVATVGRLVEEVRRKAAALKIAQDLPELPVSATAGHGHTAV